MTIIKKMAIPIEMFISISLMDFFAAVVEFTVLVAEVGFVVVVVDAVVDVVVVLVVMVVVVAVVVVVVVVVVKVPDLHA